MLELDSILSIRKIVIEISPEALGLSNVETMVGRSRGVVARMPGSRKVSCLSGHPRGVPSG